MASDILDLMLIKNLMGTHKFLIVLEAPETGYGEYFQKVELDNSNASELDGVWKHIANVTYINNIPVDTIAVPDGLDDHKTFLKGHVIVNFDFTKKQKREIIIGVVLLYMEIIIMLMVS